MTDLPRNPMNHPLATGESVLQHLTSESPPTPITTEPPILPQIDPPQILTEPPILPQIDPPQILTETPILPQIDPPQTPTETPTETPLDAGRQQNLNNYHGNQPLNPSFIHFMCCICYLGAYIDWGLCNCSLYCTFVVVWRVIRVLCAMLAIYFMCLALSMHFVPLIVTYMILCPVIIYYGDGIFMSGWIRIDADLVNLREMRVSPAWNGYYTVAKASADLFVAVVMKFLTHLTKKNEFYPWGACVVFFYGFVVASIALFLRRGFIHVSILVGTVITLIIAFVALEKKWGTFAVYVTVAELIFVACAVLGVRFRAVQANTLVVDATSPEAGDAGWVTINIPTYFC